MTDRQFEATSPTRTPAGPTPHRRAFLGLGALLFWGTLLFLVIPPGLATAPAGPTAPPAAPLAVAGAVVAAPAPAIASPSGSGAVASIPGTNPATLTPINGPAITDAQHTAWLALGHNATPTANATVLNAEAARAAAPAAAAPTPAVSIPTGQFSGYVNSSVSGLGMKGVSVQAYSKGGAICPQNICSQVYSGTSGSTPNTDGYFTVTAPVGDDYIEFTFANNVTNYTYATSVQSVDRYVGTTYLVPDGLVKGIVEANTTGSGIQNVEVCATSRDDAIQAEPCAYTGTSGSFVVAVPPVPSIVRFTPPSGFVSDFRYTNVTPHVAGLPILDLGIIYLSGLVKVKAELYDAVTGGQVQANGGQCNPYAFTITCRAITACSALSNTCQQQGISGNSYLVEAYAAPGPTYVEAFATGYLVNTVPVQNVTFTGRNTVIDLGRIYMVPMGTITFRGGVTHNASGYGPWSTGQWRVTVSSMNGYQDPGLQVSGPYQSNFNQTFSSSETAGCWSIGTTVTVPAFPGRNYIQTSPDYVPVCSQVPLWPIPPDLPVWGNNSVANVTPDMNTNAGSPAGNWMNFTAGTYVYGHIAIPGQVNGPENLTVTAQSTENSQFTPYPYVREHTTNGEQDSGWPCSESDTLGAYCVPAPMGDSKILFGSTGYPTNFTWAFTHNLCCNNTVGERAGVPITTASPEGMAAATVYMQPQGGVSGHIFRRGTNLSAAFTSVQVCPASSNSVIPGLACGGGIVYPNGSFHLPAPLGWNYVQATASGYSSDNVWVYVNGPNVDVGNITLVPLATFSGRVIDSNGNPVYEASVQTCLLNNPAACTILGIGTTTTDGYYNGTLQGGWLPWSTYSVTASATGFASDFTFGNATTGSYTTIPTIVLRGIGASGAPSAGANGVWVSGTLLDNSTGYGVSTTQISACTLSGGTCVTFIDGSNSLGQFNQSIAPGLYYLSVSPPGYAPLQFEFNASGGTAFLDLGVVRIDPMLWVAGNATIYPWGNITVTTGSGSVQIALGPGATATGCINNRTVCGLPETISSQGTFRVLAPKGLYDAVEINPVAGGTGPSAPGGFVANTSTFNTSGYLTFLNVSIPLPVFSIIRGTVRDFSAINPFDGTPSRLGVSYVSVIITTLGPSHATVSDVADGGGDYIFLVPPGPNTSDIVATEPLMYQQANVTLHQLLEPGAAYWGGNFSMRHFGWVDLKVVNSVTNGPAAFVPVNAQLDDTTNSTSYSVPSTTNGAGFANVSSMYGRAVLVSLGNSMDYNGTNLTTGVNQSRSSWPGSPALGTPAIYPLDPWGWVRSTLVNNSSGVIVPTIRDPAHANAALPNVVVTVSASNPVYGTAQSQQSGWEGYFVTDAPIGPRDSVVAQRYGYEDNSTIQAVAPNQTAVRSTINMTGDGVVAGLVLSNPGNAPLVGVSIEVCQGTSTCFQAVTNQSGVFWVLAPPGIDTVTASLDGYVSNSTVPASACSDCWTWMGTIVLNQFAFVSGLVRGLPSGLPLDKAQVALCAPLPAPVGACGFTNLTGESGQFLLTAPAGTYVLDASAPYFNTSLRPVALAPGQHVYVGTLFLEQFGQLGGVVDSATTLIAVPNAQVYACARWSGGSCAPTATTDGTGSFSVLASPGPYVVAVSAPGYADGYETGTVVAGGLTTLPPLLLVPLGTGASYLVTGTVVNASNPTQGIVGAVVHVDLNGTLASSSVTGPSGAFSLLVVWGSYDLSVSAAGYRPLTESLVVHGAVGGLTFALSTMTYTVRGVVTDGLNGEPLSGVAFAELLSYTDASGFTTVTPVPLGTSLSDGSYQFQLGNGTHRIEATYAGGLAIPYGSVNFTAAVNGAPLTHDLDLLPAPTLVRGLVVSDVTGLPVPGAPVTIQGQAADGYPISVSTQASAAGNFSVLLPAGTYTANASVVGFAPGSHGFVAPITTGLVTLALTPTSGGGSAGSSGSGGAGLLPIYVVLAAVGVIAVGLVLYVALGRGRGGRRPIATTAPARGGSR